MAKQERALVTRQRVLRAAGEVFAERGYHGSAVSEIMVRARVTKGALYFHFASKEAMAMGVLSRLQNTDTIMALAGPVRLQALIALVNSYAAPPRTDPILRGALRLAGEPEFESGIWHERLHLTITGLLTDAAHAGELLSHVDAAETAELITTMLAGLHRYAPAPAAQDGAIERIASLWRHLLPSVAIPAVIPALDLAQRPPEPAGTADHCDGPDDLLAPSCSTQPADTNPGR
ncbi:ScbR family autoregulator-binding transcription factor [Streptomyces sp. NPDC001787]|uniref:ScbR family autoregulator-binding transcription factor n=1 Tax=Streptomyces sp. NPDC001787 TaxID=3154523 RepID=UPI00331D1EBF